MKNIRSLLYFLLVLGLNGFMFALLWIQGDLPSDSSAAPWDPHLAFYPSIYACWLPALYLFFSGIWLYVLKHFPDNQHLRTYWRYECFSYLAVIVIFGLQVTWQSLGDPAIWIRGALLVLLCAKSALLFRILYQDAYPIRSAVIGVIGIGIHVLLLPFHHPAFQLDVPTLFQQAELMHLTILLLKIVGINVMALETYRLAMLLSRSKQSAVFTWLLVAFTFPILSYPKTSHLVASLLLIFILRLVFSRLDTRDLMLGLLNGTNIVILAKLVVVVILASAAGLIFWSNVRPGLGLHSTQAVNTAIRALLDAQAGLFCYTPMYWLSIFGMVYVVFFRVWDGVLLVLTFIGAYIGYHFVAYGILNRVLDPSVTIPFIPILGVFIAIAHTRFGKMTIFRYLLRLCTLFTMLLTVLFILLFPEFPHIQMKFAEIQRLLRLASGLHLAALLPSSAFQPISLKTLVWAGSALILAIFLCMARTKHGHWLVIGRKRSSRERNFGQGITFMPCIVLTCIVIGAGAHQQYHNHHPIPMSSDISLSRLNAEASLELEQPLRGQALHIIASLSGGRFLPQDRKIANVTVFTQEQRFETFTLRGGRDLADEMFEHPTIRPFVAHNRAMISRSWALDTGDDASYPAHDYYTILRIPRRLKIHKIVVKFVDPDPGEHLTQVTVNIKAITLLD